MFSSTKPSHLSSAEAALHSILLLPGDGPQILLESSCRYLNCYVSELTLYLEAAFRHDNKFFNILVKMPPKTAYACYFAETKLNFQLQSKGFV